MDPVTSLVSFSSGAGAIYVAHRVRKRRAHAAIVRRSLAAAEVDRPLVVSHLSGALASVTRQARLVRLALATPLSRFDLALLHDTPWGRRERCDTFDRALVDARMVVWDWLRSLDALSREDQEVVRGLGFSGRELSRLLFMPGVLERTADVWEECLFPTEPDLEYVSRALARAMMSLRTFELALLSWRPDPYR